jgi:hypothetical protein
MKPKPLSALNHFTVPVAISSNPLSVVPRRDLAAPTVSLPLLGPGTELLPPAMAFRAVDRVFQTRLRGVTEPPESNSQAVRAANLGCWMGTTSGTAGFSAVPRPRVGRWR